MEEMELKDRVITEFVNLQRIKAAADKERNRVSGENFEGSAAIAGHPDKRA